MSSFRRMASNHRAEIAKHEHENSLQGGVTENMTPTTVKCAVERPAQQKRLVLDSRERRS